MRGIAPNLVRVGGTSFRLDPPQQRLQTGLVCGIHEEIDERRGAPHRFAHVTEDGVALVAVVSLQAHNGIADVWRLDVLPIEIGRITSHGKIESWCDAFPELGKRSVEAPKRFDAGTQRLNATDDLDDGERDHG